MLWVPPSRAAMQPAVLPQMALPSRGRMVSQAVERLPGIPAEEALDGLTTLMLNPKTFSCPSISPSRTG